MKKYFLMACTLLILGIANPLGAFPLPQFPQLVPHFIKTIGNVKFFPRYRNKPKKSEPEKIQLITPTLENHLKTHLLAASQA